MGNNQPTANELLAERFRRFAEAECKGSSPLYEQLSYGIANDAALLALAAKARPGQPVPNLLLASVHYLLLKGFQHPLAAFYADITGSTTANGDPLPAFRAFCLEHQTAIEELLAGRLVQTNEVRRCAVLLPAFGLVAARSDKPLALIEIGASAGLNLLWDYYGYDYGTGQHYGMANSPVQLACRLEGAKIPPFPPHLPQIATRLGLDLNPIDLNNPDAVLWLRALVWPEHAARAATLQKAVGIAQQHPPRLLAGDALDLLPQALNEAPLDSALCLYHSHTVNQFSAVMRERLQTIIENHAKKRDLWHISVEWQGSKQVELRLASYLNGVKSEELLAYTTGHANWLQWLL